MKFKNLFLFISFFCFFMYFSVVYANNEDTEKIDITNIQNEIIQTSSDLTKEPNLNSRSAIVLDRNSKTILYGKKENENRKL